MSALSPLLMVYLDQDGGADAHGFAALLGYPDAHVVAGDFRHAEEALNSRPTPPLYIVIDIADRAGDCLEELDRFAQHCDPAVRVVVVGSVNDVGFYRDLKRRGVVEYFTRPAVPGEVRFALLSHHGTGGGASSGTREGTVIAFMSAASGDGASTVAINTAQLLANEFGQSTVVVDMDYQFGLLTKSLDLNAPFGIRELFDHPDRGLDGPMVSKMLVGYGDRLKIIAAPNELRLLPAIRPELIRELLHILRAQFRFVIIDVPHIWADWTAASLTHSNHNVMVAQLWLRSVTHASRLLSAWKHIGIGPQSVSMIINRSGAKFKEAITAQDFERVCNKKIDFYLANDIKTVANAENHGKTIAEMGTSILQQQIRTLAQTLMDRCGNEAQTPPNAYARPDPRKGLLALLPKPKKGG